MTYLSDSISQQPCEIDGWFKLTVSRKPHIAIVMVTWPTTSRDPKKSRSWPKNPWGSISEKPCEIRVGHGSLLFDPTQPGPELPAHRPNLTRLTGKYKISTRPYPYSYRVYIHRKFIEPSRVRSLCRFKDLIKTSVTEMWKYFSGTAVRAYDIARHHSWLGRRTFPPQSTFLSSTSSRCPFQHPLVSLRLLSVILGLRP